MSVFDALCCSKNTKHAARNKKTTPSDDPDLQFMPNDLVVLIPDKSKNFVENALNDSAVVSRDDLSTLRKHNLVGHSEFRRDSLDGLLVRVSKRWWATVGTQDMYLLKLGSNITAVREFNALCRVDSLPLKRYILGEHLVDKTNNHARTFAAQNPHDLLETMGGTNALGKGFISYIQNKFNPSQLAAISAAAEEYGDGGFTL